MSFPPLTHSSSDALLGHFKPFTKKSRPRFTYGIVMDKSSFPENTRSGILLTYVFCCMMNGYVSRPFLVTCTIMQKNGAGMITATSCYWDRDTDGKHPTFQFPKDSYFFCRACLHYSSLMLNLNSYKIRISIKISCLHYSSI